MTTKKYLLQLRTIDLEIAMSQSEAQSWRDLATKMHHEPSDIRVDSSPAPDRMESLVVKAADCACEADKQRDILLYTKITIEKQIKGLKNSFYRGLLWGYYHDSKSTGELAKYVNYTGRHIERLLVKAEKDFENEYGSKYL